MPRRCERLLRPQSQAYRASENAFFALDLLPLGRSKEQDGKALGRERHHLEKIVKDTGGRSSNACGAMLA